MEILHSVGTEAVGFLPPPSELQRAQTFFALPNGANREILARRGTFEERQNAALLYAAMNTLTVRKLTEIGLTMPQYQEAFDALRLGDLASVQRLSNASLAIIKERSHPETTAEQYRDSTTGKYSPDRQVLHEGIIADQLKNGTPQRQPRLLVLAGPMAAGKSSICERFVSEVRGAVRADPDELRHHLLPDFDPLDYRDVLATNDEVFSLSDLVFDKAVAGKRNIVYEGTLRTATTYKAAIEACADAGYTITAAYVYADLAECFRRALAYRERAVALHYLCTSTQGLEEFFRLFIDDTSSVASVGIVDNSAMTDSLLYGRSGATTFRNDRGLARIRATYKNFAGI